MSGFDHLAGGTSEADWLRAALDAVPRVAAAAGRLVVLAAHPDDETLGAGGLIAASAHLGADIDVVVATDGEASHPASPTHSPHDLASIRRREVHSAISCLAPRARVHHLGLPDGELQQHVDDLAGALAAIVGAAPTRLVSPWRDDRHPDHEAAAESAARLAVGSSAIEHWQYPIWWWHWGDPDVNLPGALHRLELADTERSAKLAALAEHASQHAPLSLRAGDEAILPPRIIAHFERRFECFLIGPAAAAQPAYFDALYAESPDPWGLGERFYEQRKRDLVVASLPRRHFARVFEPGCATGLLTARLAERADEVIAWDVASVALEQASSRLATSRGVQVRHGRIPLQWPSGEFDLIVLSEVAYYCDDLDLLVRRVVDSLAPDGTVLGCHWVREARDHPHTAADVHAAFDRVLTRVVQHLEDDFRLDVWARDGRSVATREGIT